VSFRARPARRARGPSPRTQALRDRLSPLLAAALGGALVLLLAGCGLGAGPVPSAVQLTVTSDFGAHTLGRSGPLKVAGQETVMSLLVRNYDVATRFGGGFVQSIDGLSGGDEGGEPVDWFYYVNGVEAPRGAASTNVHPGDQIWWDRHDWSQTEDVPAVVGSFPQPFLNGLGGKRYPVRIECASVGSYACRTVTARLRRQGVPAAIAAVGTAGEPEQLRVLVGRWRAVEGDPGTHAIEEGPRASGVYARFSASGSTLALLAADGRAVRTLGAGSGLIAATRQGEDAPVWVVTGGDETGLERAAGALDQAQLHDHFAVAVDEAGVTPLPVGAG